MELNIIKYSYDEPSLLYEWRKRCEPRLIHCSSGGVLCVQIFSPHPLIQTTTLASTPSTLPTSNELVQLVNSRLDSSPASITFLPSSHREHHQTPKPPPFILRRSPRPPMFFSPSAHSTSISEIPHVMCMMMRSGFPLELLTKRFSYTWITFDAIPGVIFENPKPLAVLEYQCTPSPLPSGQPQCRSLQYLTKREIRKRKRQSDWNRGGKRTQMVGTSQCLYRTVVV